MSMDYIGYSVLHYEICKTPPLNVGPGWYLACLSPFPPLPVVAHASYDDIARRGFDLTVMGWHQDPGEWRLMAMLGEIRYQMEDHMIRADCEVGTWYYLRFGISQQDPE